MKKKSTEITRTPLLFIAVVVAFRENILMEGYRSCTFDRRRITWAESVQHLSARLRLTGLRRLASPKQMC